MEHKVLQELKFQIIEFENGDKRVYDLQENLISAAVLVSGEDEFISNLIKGAIKWDYRVTQ